MFILNPKDNTPIFVQLKKQIMDFIVLDVLKPDDQLPSVRSLANQLGINPNTVSRTYNELELEGYIYSIAGKGCFIKENKVKDRVIIEKMDMVKHHILECQKYGIKKDDLIKCIEDIYGKE